MDSKVMELEKYLTVDAKDPEAEQVGQFPETSPTHGIRATLDTPRYFPSSIQIMR